MSSGNQNSCDYGDSYRHNRDVRQNEDIRRLVPNPSLGPRGYPYPPPPPCNPYSPMYGQLPMVGGHNPSSIYSRGVPPVPPPPRFGYDRGSAPGGGGTGHPDWSSPAGPMAYNGYSNNNNNNNNNYQNQVSDWTQYHQNSWQLGAPALGAYSQQPVPAPNHQSSPAPYIPPPPPKATQQQQQEFAISPAPVVNNKRTESSESPSREEKDEEKELKKPVPIMVGKRRGGKVLPTGVVKKQRTGSATQGRTDAWGQYMAEVKKYKEQSCEEERKNRPLVK